MHVHAWYFTGTGNSRDACETALDELAAAGYEWTMELIEPGSDPVDIPESDLILLVFPVYAWQPPALVRAFVRRLRVAPPAGGTPPASSAARKAVVLAIDGGEGMRAADDIRRLLEEPAPDGPGLDVVVSQRVQYPENWTQFIPPDPEDQARRETAEGRERVRSLMRNAVSGNRNMYQPSGFMMIVSRVVGLLFSVIGRTVLSQFFVADDRCTSCGLCERTCPVKAIRMQSVSGEPARPRWELHCESCNRCINICPERAIVTSWGRIVVTLAVIAGLVAGGFALSGFLFGLPKIIAGVTIVLGAHFVAVRLLPGLFASIERIPAMRKVMSRGFNGNWPRYIAPGFQPLQTRKKNGPPV